MDVDERFVQIEIAMGTTGEEAQEIYQELLEDKSLDCTSKILKKIMTLELPDEKKAYLCFQMGIMKGKHMEQACKSYIKGGAALQIDGKIDDLIKEGAEILDELKSLKRYQSLGQDERDEQAEQVR